MGWNRLTFLNYYHSDDRAHHHNHDHGHGHDGHDDGDHDHHPSVEIHNSP